MTAQVKPLTDEDHVKIWCDKALAVLAKNGAELTHNERIQTGVDWAVVSSGFAISTVIGQIARAMDHKDKEISARDEKLRVASAREAVAVAEAIQRAEQACRYVLKHNESACMTSDRQGDYWKGFVVGTELCEGAIKAHVERHKTSISAAAQALLDNQRTPGTVEVCELCDAAVGSPCGIGRDLDTDWGQHIKNMDCPIRKPVG